MKIGVVSDTHGLFRPELVALLAGVERILHLGDVGKASVLEALAKIAPVTAIRGNTDRDGPCAKLPETDVTLIADRYIYMLHDLNTLHLDQRRESLPPCSSATPMCPTSTTARMFSTSTQALADPSVLSCR